MSSWIDHWLLHIEGWLAKRGLPAGPDALINRNTILGLVLGVLGAAIGWVISEPWREGFSWVREYFIWAAVGCLIWLFVVSKDFFFNRSAKLLVKKALAPAYWAPLAILLAAALAEFIAYAGSPVTYRPTLKIFVLDVSSSMHGAPLATLKSAITKYVEALKHVKGHESVSLACVSFSDNATLISDPTKDLTTFVNRVQNITATGYTNMAAGLNKAKDIIQKSGESAASTDIIMVSDGQPNLPRGDPLKPIWDLQPYFKARGVNIYAIGAGPDYDRGLLEAVARTTEKGRFMAADNIGELVEIMGKLGGGTILGTKDVLPLLYRVLAWGLVGISIGLCCAIPRRTTRALMYGAVGGVAGGVAGALAFAVLHSLFSLVGITSGVFNRMAGFTILGACVGLGYTLVEAATRPAWLRVLSGHHAGTIMSLDRPEMVLGSSDKADLTILGDPEISEKNVRFVRSGREVTVETLGPTNLSVNGTDLKKAVLQNEDTFMVAGTKFLFLNKLAGMASRKVA
ncbi:MAG: VWA domain-containing protein [Desulfomonile tiedjei]|uniref:VWA domain-containing protein n=1 Tax=Desulfomonile tiedjei TaxID=2358 RepID=A0A9D6V7X2_9BACT|nr:VWA domain-containing protein [Desulfomonile tiedjei]